MKKEAEAFLNLLLKPAPEEPGDNYSDDDEDDALLSARPDLMQDVPEEVFSDEKGTALLYVRYSRKIFFVIRERTICCANNELFVNC